MTGHDLRRRDRLRLILYAVRHTAGTALLVWFSVLAYRTLPRPQAFVVTATAIGFTIFAALTWLRLLKAYRGQILPRREQH